MASGGNSWHLMPARLVLPDGCPYDWFRFAAQEIPATQIGKLYRTADGGVTWAEVFATPRANEAWMNNYIRGIEVSALNSDLVVFTTDSNVYKSERGGEAESW